jgi:hypothetical protein
MSEKSDASAFSDFSPRKMSSASLAIFAPLPAWLQDGQNDDFF